jgi:hypothetical protein
MATLQQYLPGVRFPAEKEPSLDRRAQRSTAGAGGEDQERQPPTLRRSRRGLAGDTRPLESRQLNR